MNERTDSRINQQPSILQEIDTPTNYVIIVGKIIMQVILVCVEQRENLVLHVKNKIIW